MQQNLFDNCQIVEPTKVFVLFGSQKGRIDIFGEERKDESKQYTFIVLDNTKIHKILYSTNKILLQPEYILSGGIYEVKSNEEGFLTIKDFRTQFSPVARLNNTLQMMSKMTTKMFNKNDGNRISAFDARRTALSLNATLEDILSRSYFEDKVMQYQVSRLREENYYLAKELCKPIKEMHFQGDVPKFEKSVKVLSKIINEPDFDKGIDDKRVLDKGQTSIFEF